MDETQYFYGEVQIIFCALKSYKVINVREEVVLVTGGRGTAHLWPHLLLLNQVALYNTSAQCVSQAHLQWSKMPKMPNLPRFVSDKLEQVVSFF